jgi:hypothetical protein
LESLETSLKRKINGLNSDPIRIGIKTYDIAIVNDIDLERVLEYCMVEPTKPTLDKYFRMPMMCVNEVRPSLDNPPVSK